MQISLTDAEQRMNLPAEFYDRINAPHVSYSTIDLTGDGGQVFITVCLDHKNTWPGGYMENARYLKLTIDGGKLSCICKSHKLPTFRKVKAATADEVIDKINRYISRLN